MITKFLVFVLTKFLCLASFCADSLYVPLCLWPTAAGCVPDCVNGGACINAICLCPEGYSGDYCQVEGKYNHWVF